MKKAKQFVSWVALSLAILGLTTLISANRVAADTSAPADPTGMTAPSALGEYWRFLLFNGVDRNGFVFQPSDQNVVATSGSSMTVNVTSQVTNDAGFIIFGSRKVKAVAYRRYNDGWGASFTPATKYTDADDHPTSSLDSSLSVPTTPGTYYYQLRLQFNNGSPATTYSEVFSITVVPKPVNAVKISPTANPTEVLWGQPSRITANLNPSNSTAVVSWKPNSPTGQTATVSNSTGLSTSLNTPDLTTDSGEPKDPTVLQTDNGTPMTVKATATNDDKSTVTGETKVTLGGLHPLTVEKGQSISLKPAALNNVSYPGTPQFSWRIYDADKKTYTLQSGETAELNTDTFKWNNVQGSSDKMYYQLVVGFKNEKGTAYWYSNVAPITISATAKLPTLIAVPDLAFRLSSGQDPTIADFYQDGGVKLNYVAPANLKTPTYDGNKAGVIAVGGKNVPWTLSVAFSPFKSTTGNYLTTGTGGAATLGLQLSTGSTVTLKDDNQAQQVAQSSASDFSATLDSKTSLSFDQLPSIKPGTYQSTATWTLVKGP
ncbi:protein export cytoplasm protein SecA2 ATPase RNA helicase [uncultured Secundilactobacillus sp.]|uniref:protein export cytoplasm protein SecA2 ATPase RNA helicase n=1 Tax=uncultured Secundilactobacillus sp. TaxID=2813935 RepID=UPI002591425A|nr:protein export cytoplasm protein SecA2 ATPase RNA helicase [uncultured Secundilactobacillus sp.]